MATAKVQVLHSILTASGWVYPGDKPIMMDADEARDKGYAKWRRDYAHSRVCAVESAC